MNPIVKSVLIILLVAWSGCATAVRVAPQPAELQPVEFPLPPRPAEVYDQSQVTIRPIPVYQARPVFPLELRRVHASGSAVVVFTVRTDGSVGNAMILTATDIRFGKAAAEAILQWRYRPASVNGMPVNCQMMVPISFAVREQQDDFPNAFPSP